MVAKYKRNTTVFPLNEIFENAYAAIEQTMSVPNKEITVTIIEFRKFRENGTSPLDQTNEKFDHCGFFGIHSMGDVNTFVGSFRDAESIQASGNSMIIDSSAITRVRNAFLRISVFWYRISKILTHEPISSDRPTEVR
jgi:hypothetical protein